MSTSRSEAESEVKLNSASSTVHTSEALQQGFQISNLSSNAKYLATAWLALAVTSLLASGLFSILLVLSRTPAIQELIPFVDFFHVALVVHVDLSVLIWFLAFAGVLWSLLVKEGNIFWDQLAIGLAWLGTTILVISPFLGVGNPLMNNYVPILEHPLFIGGLIVFGLGILIQVLKTIMATIPKGSPQTGSDALEIGIYASAVVTLAAIIALIASYAMIPSEGWSGQAFYEVLFWGAGHVVQYTHTLLMLVVWIWIANVVGATVPVSPKMTACLFALVAAPVIATPWIYQQYDVFSAEHRIAFTNLMKYGGLSSVLLGLITVVALLGAGKAEQSKKPVKAALICSIVLFACGGIIGFLIHGANVVIPAHYHGSIVGVTLAFMGLSYHLLPELGYAKPNNKLAHAQPYVYGGGQLMHILGLAWSGGYGVQRKTAGVNQGLENLPEIAGMALMGLGGLVSIIGGILFLIVALKSLSNSQTLQGRYAGHGLLVFLRNL